MVDVSAIATKLVGKLATKAYQEIASACNLKTDVEKLQKSVGLIRKYVVDAEEKQSKEQSKPKNERVKMESINMWLEQLKEAVEDASDILDEIEYEALRKQVMKEYASVTRKVRCYCSRSNPQAFAFKMSRKIKNIRKRVKEIKSDAEGLHLVAIDHQNKNEESPQQVLSWRETFSRRPPHMTGRNGEKEQIIDILRRPQSLVNKIDVIPIVGEGGLGKSALAQLVFNDEWVAKNFKRLWVWVFNNFELKRVMSNILKEADNTQTERNSKNFNLEQLSHFLREALRGKRFFLVLDDVWDDVWEEDAKKWQALNDVLLGLSDEENKNGSKILVTTRSHQVAQVMGTIDAHRLGELPPGECQELFLKCAFPKGGAEKYPGVKRLGRKLS